MAYDQNIPQATDRISVSQPQILANFLSIFNAFNQNHVDFNSGVSLDGKHKFLQMPVQATPPTTNTSEIGLYARTSPITADPELVFQRENNGDIFEFTSSGPRTTSNNQVAWTRLPSGILIQWGFMNTTGGNQSIAVPANDINGKVAPTYTQVPRAYLTPIGSGVPDVFVTLLNVTTVLGVTTLTVYGSQRTTTASANFNFQYLLIGI
jgi:hypothetical protein